MKLLLAFLFSVLGVSRFFSFPAGDDFVQTAQLPTHNNLQDTTENPSFTLEKTNCKPMQVLTINDTAITAADIGGVLNKGYGELFTFIYQQKLQPEKIMAFYYTSREPFVFDAAIEVNKLPGELPGRIKAKSLKGGNVVIVHYQGSYSQIGIAYTAISNWLKANNKKAIGPPFEVYLNDPVTVKDQKLLRTDVYQRIK